MEKTIRSISLALFALAMVVWLGVPPNVAEGHNLGHDSVDDCEIRWEDETQYDTARIAAHNAWEALKGNDNCVDLAPDTSTTVTDLQWQDWAGNDPGWGGLYFYRPVGADSIYLSEHWMDQYSTCRQKKTAMHELGHAHGIQHHGLTGNVMYITNLPLCNLGSHDIADYEDLWGED